MHITVASEHDVEAKGWQDYANCLGVDPDLFFPERRVDAGGEGGLPRLRRARGVPRVRVDQRREVRHLGRHERARAASHPAPAGTGPPQHGLTTSHPRAQPERARRASIVRSALRSSCAQRLEARPAAQHGGGARPARPVPRCAGRDLVVGLGRPDLVRREQVHRHLHAVAHLEAERTDRRAPHLGGDGAGQRQIAIVQPDVVRDQHRPRTDGTRTRAAMGPVRSGVRRDRPKCVTPYVGERTACPVEEARAAPRTSPPMSRTDPGPRRRPRTSLLRGGRRARRRPPRSAGGHPCARVDPPPRPLRPRAPGPRLRRRLRRA